VLSPYWARLYDVFPEWQFVLDDEGDGTVLAKGNGIPVGWDGTGTGLGPGIATIVAGFELQSAGRRPTALSALAAEIPSRHRGRRLSAVGRVREETCGGRLFDQLVPREPPAGEPGRRPLSRGALCAFGRSEISCRTIHDHTMTPSAPVWALLHNLRTLPPQP